MKTDDTMPVADAADSIRWIDMTPSAQGTLLPGDIYGLKSILHREASPENFMSPYDANRVTAANALYQQLNAVPADDFISPSGIMEQAVSQLGCRFDPDELYSRLMDCFSPKKYLHPYDEEKFNAAHTLCSRLTASRDDISAMCGILIERQRTTLEAQRIQEEQEEEKKRKQEELRKQVAKEDRQFLMITGLTLVIGTILVFIIEALINS